LCARFDEYGAGHPSKKIIVKQPERERLPRMYSSKTFSFRVADCHGYVTVGQYDDGRPGDIFLRVATEGSTLACFVCSGWATTSGFS
jgi:hypothetical protein